MVAVLTMVQEVEKDRVRKTLIAWVVTESALSATRQYSSSSIETAAHPNGKSSVAFIWERYMLSFRETCLQKISTK
jgi:hypothetical protein